MILSFGQPFFFREYMYWKQHAPLTNSYIANRLRELHNHFGELTLFRMEGSDVELYQESSVPNDARRARAELYLRLFRETAQTHPSARPVIFGACLGDTGFPDQEFPIFSFQKLRRSMNFLFPDADVLVHNFYNSPEHIDDISYESKSNTAIFIGSTSGAAPEDIYLQRRRRVTLEKIASGKVPRINSALFFQRHRENVIFDLPIIVQTPDCDTRSFLESLGFGGNVRTPMKEQFKHKFLISMDGNGAACSRLALALGSNSVPLKYKSDSILHYFSLLIDGFNFIEISKDEEVLRVVEAEAARPGIFREIAENGRSVFRSVFDKENIIKYTASVLAAYQDVTKA